jgi:glycosyltransferase involved in cell wall biosynthesis
VDDGSTDETVAVVEDFAREHGWVKLVGSPGADARKGPLGLGRRAGRDVLAFNAGVAGISEPVDIVLKLDADVSMEPNYFERLLREFVTDPQLGIAGGCCYELERGEWRLQHVTGNHVRGATRAYRRECLRQLEPLEDRLGWDGIDELRAQLLGWKTRSINGLPFYHHRPVGYRDGAWRTWFTQGEAAHYMGYRPSYLVLRALHRARRNPAAVAMVSGYVASAIRREPRYADAAVREHLRRQQSLRRLPLRLREALGRRALDSRSS